MLLLQEKELLLHLADHLSDERIISKEDVAAKAKQFGSVKLNAVKFIEDHSKLFYREHLKQQIQHIPSAQEIQNGRSFFLNKNR